MEFILIAVAVLALFLFVYKSRSKDDFKQTSYYQITHNSLEKIEADKGIEGEYLLYKELAAYEEEKKQEHIRNIEQAQANREAKRGKSCPVCGAELVVRTVKKGERQGHKFYGCSAYPKCHYTEKMS